MCDEIKKMFMKTKDKLLTYAQTLVMPDVSKKIPQS